MLTLHYIPEDEWHGELRVEARHAGFSAHASAWFSADALKKFAAPLRNFRPSLEQSIKLEGGYFSDSTTSSRPVETHVAITIAQRGDKGRYWADILLTEPDEDILHHSAQLRFYVEPYALMRFADQIEAMLTTGGSAGLPASEHGAGQPGTLIARQKIRRPFTPLFIELRESCRVLIDRMEQASSLALPPKEKQMVTEEWERYEPGLIIGTIDWEQARFIFNWAVDDEYPVRAARSPDYILELWSLKRAAQSQDHPRAWFESQALYLLSAMQDHLGAFYRDGPTDDIPYSRHLVYAQGMADSAACIWVGDVIFRYDDQPQADFNS